MQVCKEILRLGRSGVQHHLLRIAGASQKDLFAKGQLTACLPQHILYVASEIEAGKFAGMPSFYDSWDILDAVSRFDNMIAALQDFRWFLPTRLSSKMGKNL